MKTAMKDSNGNPRRNDPCFCGSGKKFKKCHLLVDRAEREAEIALEKERRLARYLELQERAARDREARLAGADTPVDRSLYRNRGYGMWMAAAIAMGGLSQSPGWRQTKF